MTHLDTQTVLSETVEFVDGPDSTLSRTSSHEFASMAFAKCLEYFVQAAGNAMQPLDLGSIAPTARSATAQYLQVCEPTKATSTAIRALERLRTFSTWKANWDAEGAPEPDGEAIDAASNLLGYLKNYNIDPTAMLDSLGKPLFLFAHGDAEAEISVLSHDTIEFLFMEGAIDRAVEVDIQFDGTRLPQELQTALMELTHKA